MLPAGVLTDLVGLTLSKASRLRSTATESCLEDSTSQYLSSSSVSCMFNLFLFLILRALSLEGLDVDAPFGLRTQRSFTFSMLSGYESVLTAAPCRRSSSSQD